MPVKALTTALIVTTIPFLHAVEWRDAFSGQAVAGAAFPEWEEDGLGWERQDGAYVGSWPSPTRTVIAGNRRFGRMVVEVTATPLRAEGNEWKVAGPSVYHDARNYWRLGLVESPETDGNRHFVELCEMRDGRWLAQGNLRSTVHRGHDYPWEYNTAYRFRIELDENGIRGTVRDSAGTVVTDIGYAFTDAAVTSGRPALDVSALATAYDDVHVTADEEGAEPIPPPAEVKIMPYAVAGSGVSATTPANGFFQVEKDGERWWLVDPRGERFYAVGTDHVNYNVHYCQELGYAPYHRNNEATYGSAEAWGRAAAARLREWGFNLLGANNSPEVRRQGLAHTLFAAFGSTFSGYSSLVEKTTWTGFPNVFHPKWEAYCRMRAKSICTPHVNDPWLLGYFLDNELEWYGKTHQEAGIFIETMKCAPDHSGKQALIAVLKEHHRSIEVFNREWGQEVADWDAVAQLNRLVPGTDAARAAQLAFLELVAERYFAVSAAAIRAVDPNHLIIGSRFAGNAPEWAWKACARHCDVVTFNNYPRIDFESGDLSDLAEVFEGYYALVEKPMIITEWSFPALDAGLPCKHGAGMRVDTQAQKTRCFEAMQHLLFRLPFMVGSDYFMWVDEPAQGISDTFPEDSNYGLVNLHDEPYPELTAACRTLNPKAYRIHAGEIPEVYVRAVTMPEPGALSVTLENLSGRAATVPLTVTAGIQTVTRDAAVAPGRQDVAVSLPLPPGPHAVEARIGRGDDGLHGCRGRTRLVSAVCMPGAPWPREDHLDVRKPLVIHNPAGCPTPAMVLPIRQVRVPLPDGTEGRVSPWTRSKNFMFVASGAAEDAVTVPAVSAGMRLLPLPSLAGGTSLSGFMVGTALDSDTARPQEGDGRTPPLVKLERRPNGGFRIDNGLIALEHDGESGNIYDRMILKGVELGSYNPLVWQNTGQDHWSQTGRLISWHESRTGDILNVAIICEAEPTAPSLTQVDDEGNPVPEEHPPSGFRVMHRISIVPNSPIVFAQCLRVSAVEGAPSFRLKAVFFYLPSAIGGSVEGDLPGGADVPNYYRDLGGAHWHDAATGGRYGCAAMDETVKVTFWLDEAGRQHPDARREVGRTVSLVLGPEPLDGRMGVNSMDFLHHAKVTPTIAIYGALDTADGPASWDTVQQTLDMWKRLVIVPLEEEKRP